MQQMRRILLTLMGLIVGAAMLWAQNTPVVLLANPAEGGTLTGAGSYDKGAIVTVTAEAALNYVFLNWTNTHDEVLSNDEEYVFLKSATPDTVIANFQYSPVYYRLTLMATPTEGGSISSGSGIYMPGTQVTVKASCASYFTFDGWYRPDGTKLSSNINYQYTTREQTDTLWAHFTFNPNSPGEPSEPPAPVVPEPEPEKFQLTAVAVPSEGGSVSGSGTYTAGTKVNMWANTNSNFTFTGWYRPDGTKVSNNQNFQYTTRDQADTLQARYTFNPGSPGDPAEPVMPEPEPEKYPLTLQSVPSEGGSVSGGGSYAAGTKVNLWANTYSNFTFTGWYRPDGTKVSNNQNFQYTTRDQADTLQARYTFNPGSPGDPAMPVDKMYSLYMIKRTGKPGDHIHMPVYLSTVDPLGNISFRLTFPNQMPPELNEISVSAEAQGYTVGIQMVNATTYVFNLTGGTTSAGTTALLTLTVPIPSNIQTGITYPVAIDQATVWLMDNTSISPSTRDGRIAVNKIGDINGDGLINLSDKEALIEWLLDYSKDNTYEEVYDVNNDGKIDVRDALRILEIIAGQQ